MNIEQRIARYFCEIPSQTPIKAKIRAADYAALILFKISSHIIFEAFLRQIFIFESFH